MHRSPIIQRMMDASMQYSLCKEREDAGKKANVPFENRSESNRTVPGDIVRAACGRQACAHHVMITSIYMISLMWLESKET